MSWEAHGTKIYSSFDIEKVQQKENAESLINELEQLGIDFDKIQEAVKLKKGRITKKIELKQQTTTLIDKKTFIKIDKALAKHEIDLLSKKIGTLKNKYSENQNAFNKKFGGIVNENLYIENVVDEIISKLKGEDRLGLIDDLGIKVGSRGPLKERTLNFVQDNELEPWLENDASKVLNYYQNTLATDIEVARAFDGDLTLDNEIAKINERLGQLFYVEKRTPKNEKEFTALMAQLKKLKEIQEDNSFSLYKRVEGEAQSRNTQERMFMDEQARRSRTPLGNFDVPVSELIQMGEYGQLANTSRVPGAPVVARRA
jgi:rRNA pseudouridine-1189 N-methylase Emg1 (Nep1/Mra1 family)